MLKLFASFWNSKIILFLRMIPSSLMKVHFIYLNINHSHSFASFCCCCFFFKFGNVCVMPVVSRNICMVYLFGTTFHSVYSMCLFFSYIFFVHSFHCCCSKVNLKQFYTGQDNHSKVCIDVWISQFTEYFSNNSQIKRDNFNSFLQKWETSAQYTGHRLTETNMETRTVSSKPNLAGSELTHFQSGSVTYHSHYTYNSM